MEKGPSTYAEYWTSTYAEVKHYIRHGRQMGFEKIEEYSKAAKEFASKKVIVYYLLLSMKTSIILHINTTNKQMNL